MILSTIFSINNETVLKSMLTVRKIRNTILKKSTYVPHESSEWQKNSSVVLYFKLGSVFSSTNARHLDYEKNTG